jgi:hypothetical protein
VLPRSRLPWGLPLGRGISSRASFHAMLPDRNEVAGRGVTRRHGHSPRTPLLVSDSVLSLSLDLGLSLGIVLSSSVLPNKPCHPLILRSTDPTVPNEPPVRGMEGMRGPFGLARLRIARLHVGCDLRDRAFDTGNGHARGHTASSGGVRWAGSILRSWGQRATITR